VRQPLPEEMLKAGENLLRLLHKHRFALRAALWLYLSEAEEWRLFLAVPGARVAGTKKFYKKLQTILATEPSGLRLSALMVVDAKAPLIYSLGPAIEVGSVGERRFSRGAIKGRYFEDAHIYRLGTGRQATRGD
jgi:hypothetical protein